LAAISRSRLLPELLQQAGLQLLQALAAPLQQWQLSRVGDSFIDNADAIGALPLFGDTLHGLVTAACGAQRIYDPAPTGEHVSDSAVVTCHSHGCGAWDLPGIKPLTGEKSLIQFPLRSGSHIYAGVLACQHSMSASVFVVPFSLLLCLLSACRAATWPAAQPSSSTPRGLHSPHRLLPAHACAAT
jgi:hypothetical protein